MKKSVLITGCSTGIGAAAAKVFSDHGWNVAATMRKPEQGEALSALPGVKVLALDVTDKTSIDAAVRQTLQDFGNIDALVNNAGYGLFGPFETASQDVIKRQFDTNLFGLFDVTRAALPGMRERRSGVIVNVASIGGLTTFPMNSLYHATKYAVVGFSESLGYELAPFGIQVKVIAPGGVATDFAGRSLMRTFEGDGGAYAPSVAKVMAAFNERRGSYSSSQSLGDAIYGAVTDGSKKTCYVVGEDAVGLLAMRKQAGDEAYSVELTKRFGLDKS
jgi:NAD(P)-dependent dehydrogenase (short-subunit alcohol dehydrogenase family)